MWRKSLILGPALLVVFVVAYAANIQGQCYVNEGVGAVHFFIGVPCFIISMVFFLRGVVTVLRERGTNLVFDIFLLVLTSIFSVALYSVPLFFERALCFR